MSKYDDKLRKAFESVQAYSQWLPTQDKPLESAIFTNPKSVGRDYANMIHDMPSDWTGMASQSAIKNKLAGNKIKHSEDHFYSRQRGGEQIVRLIKKRYREGRSPTFEEVKIIFNKYRHVHYVTKQENNKLKHIMAPGKSWREAYEEAGVILTKARPLFGKRGRHSEEWNAEMQAKYKPFLAMKKGKRRK